jgi:hypothetical protein
MRSTTARRRLEKPSWVMSSEINAAATASAHHNPKPIPTTPTMAAPAVSQPALFILARPRDTAGSPLHASAGSISQMGWAGQRA